jgi:hypothetical protein
MPGSRDSHDSVRTKKINITSTSLYSTPRTGAIEFYDNKFYTTNVAKQKVIDRTGDVLLTPVTVSNTTDETLLYTAEIGSNALVAGNVLKLRVSGKFSSASASDEVTIRIYFGGVLTDSIVSPGAQYTDDCWYMDGFGTLRNTGVSGVFPFFNILSIAEKTERACDSQTIDTTGSNDVTITSQWNNAKEGNIISIEQGLMEYKN